MKMLQKYSGWTYNETGKPVFKYSLWLLSDIRRYLFSTHIISWRKIISPNAKKNRVRKCSAKSNSFVINSGLPCWPWGWLPSFPAVPFPSTVYYTSSVLFLKVMFLPWGCPSILQTQYIYIYVYNICM